MNKGEDGNQCQLAKANLSNVDFTDANLVGADFRKVILEGSMLKRAGLVMTDLTRGNPGRGGFAGRRSWGHGPHKNRSISKIATAVDIRESDAMAVGRIWPASFSGASLRGAKLDGT